MRRPRGWTRREALKSAAAATAVACAPRGKTGDSDSAGVSAGQIDTVVMIMMENRSFDHWFGARKLEEGLSEDGLTADMTNLDNDGEAVAPFPLAEPCLDDPPHSWNGSHTQWNEGRNDGFVTNYAASSGTNGHNAMGYLRRSDLPISWALADAYTNCDRYFCSVMGPTWPNRIYGHAGSNLGVKGNDFVDGLPFMLPTVWQQVEAAGVDWAYYYADLPFIALLAYHYNEARTRLIDDFFKDAAAGRLPPVVWIDPAFTYNDNHPPKHHGFGEEFLKSVYEALAASPQWERMLVLITYDEHGGFYDHVPPPTTDDDYAEDGFDQMGFRVPATVIGPWVRKGVDSTVFDHTSWLKYLCDQHGIEPWTKRIAAANSLAAVLDTDAMAAGTPLAPITLPEFSIPEVAYDPACAAGNDVISANLMRFAERAIAAGFPVRLDPRAVAAPFRRRGRVLVG